MTFTPFFFLPRRVLIWAYEQAQFEHLLDTPFRWFFAKVDNLGIWFTHKGDEVVWTWPWRRKEREGDKRGKAPFISLGFSGNGEWGDARYWTLEELDRDWEGYFSACEAIELMSGAELVGEVNLDESGNIVARAAEGVQ